MAELPTIQLDTTLAELYHRASPRLRGKRIAQLLCGASAGIPLSAHIPRNVKYLYQDGPFNAVPEHEPAASASGAKADEQRSLAMKYLSLVPQRDAFISGDTDVVLFHIDDIPKHRAHDRSEAEQTMSVLPKAQRPNLVCCSGPADIPVKESSIDLIAHKIMLDGLEQYDLVTPPETHWFLNSKAALASSGLPTPRCDTIELDGYMVSASQCCGHCRDNTTSFPVPALCEGPRGDWVESQTSRICDALLAKKLPFVLKNQQTFGGGGTYLVRTDSERRRLLEEFQGGVLRKMLSSVTASNAHLKPGTILLSEMVADPIGDYGLTLFVCDDDSEPIFLGASEQMTDGTGAWIGSTICYSHQPELERKFGSLVKKTSHWLQARGYVGPAGADVLETEAKMNGNTSRIPTTDDFAHFHIVDLNVRTSGSLCLPLLRGHFTSRGLDCASSFSISTQKSRNEFIEQFASDFKTGKMCILSWYQDPRSGLSLADIAVGAEDGSGLEEAMRQLREATDQVTF